MPLRDDISAMISRKQSIVMTYIILICACCTLMASGSATSGEPLDKQPVTVQSSQKFTLDLNKLLADPADWSAAFDDERQSLETLVDEAQKPIDKAAAHLALANWLLANPTAMSATRWLIGMETSSDREKLTELAESAEEHLDNARKLIDAQRDALKEADADDETIAKSNDCIRDLNANLRQLQPFAELLATAGSIGDEESRRSAFSRSARGLAGLREATDDELAACALLWQSFAWEQADRNYRTQLSLPVALKQPNQANYDFMSRLLRCRTLIEHEQYAAATALAIRMRSLCAKWFLREDPQSIEARQRLVALLQCRVGMLWMAELRAADNNDNADQLEVQLAKIQQTLFADADARPVVYHLERILPIIAEPPTIEPATKPAEQPITQPSPATTSSQ